ncbi:expressed unknown protein [Seminavis robusta]|uniref:SnoaL-like domain-containing protein n=1 Tax=Seminavis robusta TaxID=568900 RepID=A0A9N8H844_9STRA|nr:expressed unknown protein [Seminavis robusta]|eukprot:Sro148_g068240.1 n/a (233) ;mRNA; r:86879-87577
MSKLFKLFSVSGKKSSKEDGVSMAKDNQDASESTGRRSSTSSKSSAKSAKSAKSNTKKSRHSNTGLKDASKVGKIVDTRTENERMIEEYFAVLNSHPSADEIVKHFTSSEAPVLFEDSNGMNAMVMATEMQKMYAGFNDFRFNYASIKEIKPGVVLVDDVNVTGTHTGPYQFANFPPVEATQKHVVLDDERLWYYVKDGKIAKLELTALGNLTGPPGLYISVGGKMDMPAGE